MAGRYLQCHRQKACGRRWWGWRCSGGSWGCLEVRARFFLLTKAGSFPKVLALLSDIFGIASCFDDSFLFFFFLRLNINLIVVLPTLNTSVTLIRYYAG